MEPQKYSHEERVRLGRELCGLILKAHGDHVLTVYIYGSTSKKLDRPYSDLEIICVIRDGVEIPAKHYVYQGIVVEVAYFQESNILKAASEVKKDWPIEADSYRNRLVLYERDGWLKLLDEAIAHSDQADMNEALRIASVELVEDLSVLRNAHLARDAVAVKIRGRAIAQDATRLVFLLNRRYITTTSWFWKEAYECPWKPRDFRRLVETVCDFVPTTPDEINTAGEQLCSEILQMVRFRGITVESETLIV